MFTTITDDGDILFEITKDEAQDLIQELDKFLYNTANEVAGAFLEMLKLQYEQL